MGKSKFNTSKLFLFLLAIITIIFVIFARKALFFLVLSIVGFFTAFIIFKTRMPINISANFFISLFVMYFYNVFYFFIFIFLAEMLPRLFVRKGFSGRVVAVYIIWIILALISLNLGSSFIMSGLIATVLRYVLVTSVRAVQGVTILNSLIGSLPQLIVNALCFIYLGPVFTLIMQ
jgi:hypothetical protein